LMDMSAVSVLEKNAESAMQATRMAASQAIGMSCKGAQPQCRPSRLSSTSLLPKYESPSSR
jgi:hypothetical protein